MLAFPVHQLVFETVNGQPVPLQPSQDVVCNILFGAEDGREKAVVVDALDAFPKSVRIIADHTRSSVFILGDQRGVTPDRVGAGYVLRRLIRRAVRHGMKLGIDKDFMSEVAATVIENFKGPYPELEQTREKVYKELAAEEAKFRQTLKKGEAEFQKLLPNLMKNPKKIISGKVAYNLYETYGYPLELTQELGAENGFTVDVEGFKEAERKHQEASKTVDAGAAKP